MTASAVASRWQTKTERGRCLDVNDKIKLGRLLDRDIAGFCAMQNFVDHVSGPDEQIAVIRSGWPFCWSVETMALVTIQIGIE